MQKISKRQFDVLYTLFENPTYTDFDLARTLYVDIKEIEQIVSLLNNYGLLSNKNVTEKGYSLLEDHKVENALILAAGMSTRFVPLNFEKPKGLLTVKGEVLIERQIRQLKEKGIHDIYIVVGYMHDKFEYLKSKFGVKLIVTYDYREKNNHASVYAAKSILSNTIVSSSDLYFTENIFQKYAYDAYYCTVYVAGKTPERGVVTDNDDKFLKTMYGDKCYDIWVTLGYAFFSKRFSANFIDILEKEFNNPDTGGKFWADIQDDHLDDLFMYAKRCSSDEICEFDSLEELREFDTDYLVNSGSSILRKICYQLAVSEDQITELESLKHFKPSLFRFSCVNDRYLCDVKPDESDKISYQGRMYYSCRDLMENNVKLFKEDKNIHALHYIRNFDHKQELNDIYTMVKDFGDYHKRTLPLCAAENVISHFGNLPLSYGFQERYIMNNTYSFNMEDNFIGCEKLYPFYKKLSEVCERVFGSKYVDPRPFTGMHCIDMIVKTICNPGDTMMILGSEHGGHASVKPVVERLGIVVSTVPYDIKKFDIDYDQLNYIVKKEKIKYILLAPSDLIKPLDVDKIDTSNCVLMWDCSQLMGLIAAGLVSNPLLTMNNIIMFGGTHKTFPGPASGLILTNSKELHKKMEMNINPRYLRHSQMHQKISLLFTLIEFEKYGQDYMSHMVHCSNYLGKRLRDKGFDIADIDGQVSFTHQIFIRCSKELMDIIYNNAYKCEVTLNKKHKQLFDGYGIRLGTQELSRYDWDDNALDIIAEIVYELTKKDVNINKVANLKSKLPPKDIKFAFSDDDIKEFLNIMG